MTEEELIFHFPVLYHVTEADAWPSIVRHGLESTSALLDRFKMRGAEREAIESNRRESSVTLRHSRHLQVRISDQGPINLKMLSRCLQGVSLSEWFELLNRRVFFWATRERLNRLLNARMVRGSDRCVLTIDTAALVARYRKDIQLCAMNSGCTRPPQPRGHNTFASIPRYSFDESRRRRGLSKAIAEVTVLRRVDEVKQIVVRAETYRGIQPHALIWQRSQGGENG